MYELSSNNVNVGTFPTFPSIMDIYSVAISKFGYVTMHEWINSTQISLTFVDNSMTFDITELAFDSWDDIVDYNCKVNGSNYHMLIAFLESNFNMPTLKRK